MVTPRATEKARLSRWERFNRTGQTPLSALCVHPTFSCGAAIGGIAPMASPRYIDWSTKQSCRGPRSEVALGSAAHGSVAQGGCVL